ncbi:MAG: hypothetical protein OEY48_07140 [Gammaproteobacteria bacterium]|nr:hypothetical protein [Gammaproteobacteria bacterium]MDH5592607.1 hypothetical protein [Gammaproteobacteria bacterium]
MLGDSNSDFALEVQSGLDTINKIIKGIDEDMCGDLTHLNERLIDEASIKLLEAKNAIDALNKIDLQKGDQ